MCKKSKNDVLESVENAISALREYQKRMERDGYTNDLIIKKMNMFEIGFRYDLLRLTEKVQLVRNVSCNRCASDIRENVQKHLERHFLPIVMAEKREEFNTVVRLVLQSEKVMKYLNPRRCLFVKEFHILNLYTIVYELAVNGLFFGTKDDYLNINKTEIVRKAFPHVTNANNYANRLNSHATDEIAQIVRRAISLRYLYSVDNAPSP